MFKKLSFIFLVIFMFALAVPGIAGAKRYLGSDSETLSQKYKAQSTRTETRLNSISLLESNRADWTKRDEVQNKTVDKIKYLNNFPEAEDKKIVNTESETKKIVDTQALSAKKVEIKTESTPKKVVAKPVEPTKTVEKKVEPTPAEPQTSTASVSQFSKIEQLAFKAVNKYRIEQGLSALEWNEKIAVVARKHSSDMAEGLVPFSHDGFDGRFKQIKTLLPIKTIAENVAYNYGYEDPASKAVEGWIKSAGHLKNIKGDYNLSGLGVAKNANGQYYLTQIFVK